MATPMIVDVKCYGFATISFMLFLLSLVWQVGDEICEAIKRIK